MLRKTAVILTLLLASVATQVYALGLGTISVDSALNQPLRVRIEVLQLGNTRLDELVIRMATPDDFQGFDIERVGFLSSITFSLESSAAGNYVLLTSLQIVREPYLSFVLETRWPNGRLLSQHTVLLDLPVFDDQQISASVRQPISPILQAPSRSPSQPFVQPEPDEITPTVTTPVSPPLPQSVEPSPPQEQVRSQDPVESSSADEQMASTEPTPLAPVLEPVDEPAEPVLEEAPVAETVAEPEAAIVADAELEEPVAEPEQSSVEETVADETVVAEEVIADEEPAPELATEDVPAAEVEEADAEVVDAAGTPEPEPEVVETIETSPTDTLSDIALQVRPDDSVTLEQTMLALQQENPQAFDDDNINNLRSGEVLRVPTLAEIQAIDPREALTEVNRQNQEFAQVDVEPLVAPDQTTPDQPAAEQGQLSVVSADDDATAIGAAPSELIQEENAELDQRIAELQSQLAVQQEEVDRAAVEREDLDSRLVEVEAQIVAAEEIIRLQDLQLAQLQESLAQAAEIAASEAEIAEPVAPATSLMDDVVRILSGNTLLLGFGVVFVILMLVAVLLRRNRAGKAEEDELDELEDSEIEAATEADDAEPVAEQAEDGDGAELDEELDEIIGDDHEEPKSDSEYDVVSEAVRLIQAGQLERAETLARRALKQNPDNVELRWMLAELLADQGDLAGFEQQAEILGVDKEAEMRLQNLLDNSNSKDDGGAEPEAEPEEEPEAALEPEQKDEEQAETESGESNDEKDLAATASFLDDLGIDLDAFDDIEDYDEEADDKAGEEASSQPADEDALGGAESFEPDEMALTFDLGGDEVEAEKSQTVDEPIAEEDSGDTDSVTEALETDIEEFDEDDAVVEEQEQEQEQEQQQEQEEAAAEIDIDADDGGEIDAKTEGLEEEVEQGVEFDVGEKASAEEEAKREVEEVSYSFDAEDEPAAVASPEATTERTEDGVEFSFDQSEIDAEPESVDVDAEIESLDFDVEDSAGTNTEETAAEHSEPELPDEATIEVEEIDWNPDESEVDSAEDDEAEVAAIDDPEVQDDDVELEFDLDEDEVSKTDEQEEISADAASGSEEETDDLDDDLGFISDDEVEIESVDDIEEVQLLPVDESATKLELAYAYHKMGDVEGAKEILLEVIEEGTEEQVTEAGKLLLTLDKSSD